MDYSRMNPAYKKYNEPSVDVPENTTVVSPTGTAGVVIVHPTGYASSTNNIFTLLMTLAWFNSPVQFIY